MYRPWRAWAFGTVYFVVCLLVGWWAGVLPRLFTEAVGSAELLRSVAWLIATLTVSGHAVFGYLYVWPRGTTSHGRPARPLLSLVFGIAWGFAQSQLVLAFYSGIGAMLETQWLTLIVTVLAWSLFAGLWQSRFWDVYVAPDHNIREWNLRKVIFVHLPFLILTLLHYTVFGNTAIFVAWWVFALATCAWAMRIPAPWDPSLPAHDGRGVSVRANRPSA